MRNVASIVGTNNLRLLLVLAILAAIVTAASPYFLTTGNLVNIGQAVAVLGILAVAETVVIASGGLDLSVGSVPGLCAVSAATIMAATHNPGLGLAGAFAVGATAGLLNGLLIVVGRVNPIIATLATLTAYKGAALLIAQGGVIGILEGAFNAIGSARILAIPIPILILSAMAIAVHLTMRYTDYGRHIYAMGGNPLAARLAGIRTNRFKLAIYTFAGLSSALAGIVLSARATGASALQGQGLEFDVITAVVLGGAGLAGGRGTIFGTILGVVILGTLYNGLILAQVEGFWQFVAKGGLLAGAVVLQERRRPR